MKEREALSDSDKSVGVLLSGGVDSAAALKQLQLSGFTKLTAYYLKIWLEDELSYLGECPWEEDMQYVKETCEKLNVPLQIINLQSEYLERVVDEALKELKQGLTPSPDIYCNEKIKFGSFYDKLSQDHDFIASGHYAQLKRMEDGSVQLHLAPRPHQRPNLLSFQPDSISTQKFFFPLAISKRVK